MQASQGAPHYGDNENAGGVDLEPEDEPNSQARPVTEPHISGAYVQPHIVHYGCSAGMPQATRDHGLMNYGPDIVDGNNIYAPFSGKLEWDFARWAKFQSNLSASAVTELLAIDGVSFIFTVNLNRLVQY